MPRTDLSELAHFYSLLYPLAEGWVEVRAFSGLGRVGERSFTPAGDALAVARSVLRLGKTRSIYSGVCTRTEEAVKNRQGTRDSLLELPALWADLDAKCTGSLEAARAALDRFPSRPSILVFTGHGYHAYWLLEKLVRVPDAGIPRLEAVLRTLQVDVLGMDNVSDLPRILRAPLTWNRKDEAHPVRTQLIFTSDRRYSLGELCGQLPALTCLPRVDERGGGLVEGRFSGLERVLASDFMAHCRREAKSLSEPLWYAMITNLIGFRGGREAIHELSCPHPAYSHTETETKIEHALRDAPGPHSYRFIAERGFMSDDLADPGLVSPASRAFVEKREGKAG